MTTGPIRKNVGDRVTVKAAFTKASTGVPADPTTVVFRVLSPDGIATTSVYPSNPGPISKTGLGLYQADVDFTMPHDWLVRVEGTGAVERAEELEFTVNESRFYP